jgi:hypothetical protein
MGKYQTTYDDVYSIFASPEWVAEGIKTIPADVLLKENITEFIRVSVIPSGEGINNVSISGLIIVEIFTQANRGPLRAITIADKLDKHLSQQSKNSTAGKNTQFYTSNLVPNGVDRDNPDLVKSTFSVQFNHYGII